MNGKNRQRHLTTDSEPPVMPAKANDGYGHCRCCGRTWNVCECHPTQYDEGEACFPLCEECWSQLTPETRLPYYRTVWIVYQKPNAPHELPARTPDA